MKGEPLDINNDRHMKKEKGPKLEPKAMDTDRSSTSPNASKVDRPKPTFIDMVNANNTAKKKIKIYNQEEFEIEDEDIIIDKDLLIPEVWFSERLRKN